MYVKDMIKTRTVKMIDLITGEIIVHSGRCITKVISLQNQYTPLNLQVTFQNGRTVTIDTRSYGVIIE